MEGFALDLEQRILMCRIEHQLAAIIAALMASNLYCAIQDAYQSVGSRHSERAADCLGRKGIIV
jgi:hypothetical protein